MAGYYTMDCAKKADTICIDPADGTFVAAKLSATKSSKIRDCRYWVQIRDNIQVAMSNKPVIKRGLILFSQASEREDHLWPSSHFWRRPW